MVWEFEAEFGSDLCMRSITCTTLWFVSTLGKNCRAVSAFKTCISRHSFKAKLKQNNTKIIYKNWLTFVRPRLWCGSLEARQRNIVSSLHRQVDIARGRSVTYEHNGLLYMLYMYANQRTEWTQMALPKDINKRMKGHDCKRQEILTFFTVFLFDNIWRVGFISTSGRQSIEDTIGVMIGKCVSGMNGMNGCHSMIQIAIISCFLSVEYENRWMNKRAKSQTNWAFVCTWSVWARDSIGALMLGSVRSIGSCLPIIRLDIRTL